MNNPEKSNLKKTIDDVALYACAAVCVYQIVSGARWMVIDAKDALKARKMKKTETKELD